MNERRIRVAGEVVVLLSQRALWWPRHKALMLADVHFGKGSVLRRAGVAIPAGQTLADLRRIDALIEQFQPARIIVLGDLVHGDAKPDTPWLADVLHWRARHTDVWMTLVAGNHDRHFDATTLGFEVIAGQLAMPPFLLCHIPRRVESSYVLAGHIHPAITVRDGWRRHRLPAFRFDQNTGLLPAFGALTGLHEDRPKAQERIYAVTPSGLLAVTADN